MPTARPPPKQKWPLRTLALLSSPRSRRPVFAIYLEIYIWRRSLLPPSAPRAATARHPHPAIIPAAAEHICIESVVSVGRDSVARSTSRQHVETFVVETELAVAVQACTAMLVQLYGGGTRVTYGRATLVHGAHQCGPTTLAVVVGSGILSMAAENPTKKAYLFHFMKSGAPC